MVTLKSGWISEYFNSWLAQNQGIIEINNRQEDYNYNLNYAMKNVQQSESLFGNIISGVLSAASLNIGGVNTMIQAGQDVVLNPARLQQLTQNHAEYINMQLAIKEQQQLLPNTNTLSSSNATLLGYEYMGNNIFSRYSIKRQFAERIDNYWSMYGYLTNNLKIPNINNRPNWNYVKTLGMNITGEIPQDDLQSIKTMFDSGVTLWHNPQTFLDYSQNNR